MLPVVSQAAKRKIDAVAVVSFHMMHLSQLGEHCDFEPVAAPKRRRRGLLTLYCVPKECVPKGDDEQAEARDRHRDAERVNQGLAASTITWVIADTDTAFMYLGYFGRSLLPW